jgi:hypothetical protein
VNAASAVESARCKLCGHAEHAWKHPTPPKGAVPLFRVYLKTGAHAFRQSGRSDSDWPDTVYCVTPREQRDRGKVAIYLHRDEFGVWVRVTHAETSKYTDIPMSNVASMERLEG